MASQCIEARATSAGPKYEVRDLSYNDLAARLPGFEAYLLRSENVPLSRHPAWLLVLQEGLRHIPYCLEATEDERTCGFLALAYVRSLIFGRVLVSLPYVNYGGIVAKDDLVMELLID